MVEIEELVVDMELIQHPEGGFYKEVYRSSDVLKKQCLPDRFSGDRNVCTSIYYLLPGNTFSSFHRIKSDETWHFYGGTTLSIYIIDVNGFHSVEKLGRDISVGESFQITVKAGCWFAAKVDEENSYTLAGCTVSPGFDFADFELADRNILIKEYPEHEALIRQLTR
ncbi:cupin domain-containing protein [soil metagenome]